MAALYDLAMLAGMYVMFGGFMQGATMVGTAGVTATEFTSRLTPFLAAMTGSFCGFARIIDTRDDEHPHTKAYLERLRERPSFMHVLKEAEPYFKNFPG